MAETLGEKLRAAREERGVSVSEVAEQTRIAPMYIECIENDNYKPLPGGIFNKGFVKSYARFIGYDEQQALEEYNRLLSQTEGTQDDHLRSYRPEVLTDDRASQSTIPTIIFAGIILALMTGGVLFLVNYLQRQPATPVATNTAATNQATQVTPQTQEPVAAGNAPTMQNLKVEFKATTENISLEATSDGNKSNDTLAAGSSKIFEPKQSLVLKYSWYKAAVAQLFLNGKQIALPSPASDSKKGPVVIDINASNLSQIWTAGAISFDSPAAPLATPSTSVGVGATTSNTQTPRPATPSPAPKTSPAASNAARATPTPIIAGGNRNATARPTPN